jgi:ribonuclease HIII
MIITSANFPIKSNIRIVIDAFITSTNSDNFPTKTNILIVIDAFNSSANYDEYLKQKSFIANKLVTDKWTNFERLALITNVSSHPYGVRFGSISSYRSFKSIVDENHFHYDRISPHAGQQIFRYSNQFVKYKLKYLC